MSIRHAAGNDGEDPWSTAERHDDRENDQANDDYARAGDERPERLVEPEAILEHVGDAGEKCPSRDDPGDARRRPSSEERW